MICVANTSGPIWSEFYITDAGLRLRTEVIAEAGTIVFSRAEVGEGKPGSLLEIGTMTGLVTFKEPAYVVRSFAISAENTHGMVIKIDNEQFNNEVLVTEVGVYAKKEGSDTEILYGYAYALVGYASMPAGADGHRTWNLVFNTKISRSSGVTVNYDGSGVFLSFKEFEFALSNYYTKIEIDVFLTDLNEQLANKANIQIDPTQKFDLEFNAAYFTKGYRCDYSKNALNQVSIILSLAIIPSVSIPSGTIIAYLPEGFRPSARVVATANLKRNTISNMTNIDIDQSGNIYLFSNDTNKSASDVGESGGVFMNVVFDV